jgi:MacB-like periplasmic core domain
LTERLASLPGVRAAAFSDHSLVGGRLAMPSLTVPGRPREAQEDRTVYYQAVSAGFFDTMEMRVVAGRGFVGEDRGRRIAVVNETLAQRFFDAHAIGRRVAITKDPTAPDVPDADQLDIIGVVRDAKYMTLRARQRGARDRAAAG